MITKALSAIYLTLIWPLVVIDWRVKLCCSTWAMAGRAANQDVVLAWQDCWEVADEW